MSYKLNAEKCDYIPIQLIGKLLTIDGYTRCEEKTDTPIMDKSKENRQNEGKRKARRIFDIHSNLFSH